MKEKVLIIGAGISGLYLAYLLQGKYEVTILEARDRIGGRIFSVDGHDLGPSWVWSHHRETLALLKELNLELFRQYDKGYALYDDSNKVELFNPQASAPAFRVQGSLSALVNTLRKKLERTNIVLSQEVKKIQTRKESVAIITPNNDFESDYVVCTLAPRLAVNIAFEPSLPDKLKNKMLQTQTWMGNSMKCVIEFDEAFWKEQGLSGFMFSNRGPIAEMHDASTNDQAALFGFIHSKASLKTFEQDVIQQVKRVFKIKRERILKIYFVDWKNEKFTASLEDSNPLRAHPEYGIDTSSYSDKIYFSSTEFSFSEGGYIEGAILNAQKIAQEILKN